jgi:hypothetical protein
MFSICAFGSTLTMPRSTPSLFSARDARARVVLANCVSGRLSLNKRYDLIAFGAIMLGVVLLSWIEPTRIGTNDWLQFAGSILGASMTLLAGWLALKGVKTQIAAEVEARSKESEKIQSDAKKAAKFAITLPIQTAAIVVYNLNAARRAIGTPELGRAVEVFYTSVHALSAAVTHFSIQEVARDLRREDRISYIGILSSIHTFLSLVKHQPPGKTIEQLLPGFSLPLRNVHRFLKVFDSDLCETFERESKSAVPLKRAATTISGTLSRSSRKSAAK